MQNLKREMEKLKSDMLSMMSVMEKRMEKKMEEKIQGMREENKENEGKGAHAVDAKKGG